MFSQRLPWPLTTNRLNLAREEKKAAGVEILDLTESNPTHAGLIYNEAELLRALSPPESIKYEPDSRGLEPARTAVASYYAERGEAVDLQNLFLTASTSEAYAYLFKLLANPGDEILAPLPCYPLLDFLAALESVHLQHYPLRYDETQGWQIDFAVLENLITTKTVALVLVHPNNPTGSFLKTHELARLNALCLEHHLALLCDEVFLDYASDANARPASLVSNQATLTFVVSGLSKISALPQMKLGWIYVAGPEAWCQEASTRLEFIADTYLSVGTPVQHAAEKLLALRHDMQRQIQARTQANLAFLLELCRTRPNCRVLLREGGWYAVLKIPPEISEERFCVSLLKEGNVFVHPGYFFDFAQPGFLVLSLLTPPRIFQEGTQRMLTRL